MKWDPFLAVLSWYLYVCEELFYYGIIIALYRVHFVLLRKKIIHLLVKFWSSYPMEEGIPSSMVIPKFEIFPGYMHRVVVMADNTQDHPPDPHPPWHEYFSEATGDLIGFVANCSKFDELKLAFEVATKTHYVAVRTSVILGRTGELRYDFHASCGSAEYAPKSQENGQLQH